MWVAQFAIVQGFLDCAYTDPYSFPFAMSSCFDTVLRSRCVLVGLQFGIVL